MENEIEAVDGPDRLREDIESVQVWAESLNRDVLDVDDVTFETAAAYLERLRSSISLLRDSEQALEAWLAAVWKDQDCREGVVVEGVGTVEVKRAKDRKEWDHAGLGKAVLEATMRDRHGEVPSPWDVRDAIMAAAGIGYWKVTELKRLGINVGDYCTQVPGTRRVIIT